MEFITILGRMTRKELFYLAGAKLMAVEVKTDSSTFEAGIPKALFEARLGTVHRNRYVVAANGQRFLLNTLVEESATSPITVVLNWTTGLKR